MKKGKLTESEKLVNKSNIPILMSLGFIASFIGQCFGLGGGFIYGPILLSIGFNPLVIAATCLYLIIFSSTSSLFMFAFFGQVNVSYALWIMIFTGLGVFIGLFSIKELMKRYKRPSFVVFALGIAILISNILAI